MKVATYGKGTCFNQYDVVPPNKAPTAEIAIVLEVSKLKNIANIIPKNNPPKSWNIVGCLNTLGSNSGAATNPKNNPSTNMNPNLCQSPK